MNRIALLAAGLVSAALTGCVAPPSAADRDPVTALATPSPSATLGDTISGGAIDAATWQAITSRARRSLIRVRNQTCDGVATGSGFVSGLRTLITNAHVVDGARKLSADTADGVHRDVTVADIAIGEDISFVRTSEDLPAPLPLADADPVPGDLVQALGFPLGKQLAASPGRVTASADGEDYEHRGPVLQSSVSIHPGNSGGPLLDRTGHVVGVMFAIDLRDGSALAIPVSRLREVLKSRARRPVTGDCETSGPPTEE